MRVGYGYDSHRFDPQRSLVLGGVRIPGAPGLSGHSDADAVAHAVSDALLGAAAFGDIGLHFPPDDARWKDADSIALLEQVVGMIARRQYQVVNVDVTVICETPRIAPYGQAMRERLAAALQVDPAQISIKGKTNEGLGWIGAGEGLAVHAVALIEERASGGRGGRARRPAR